MCGEAKDAVCQPPRGESYYDYSCPSGYEGYLWYVWDYYSCEYEIRDKTYDQNPSFSSTESWVVNTINNGSCRYMINAGIVPSNLNAVALYGCNTTDCGSCSASQVGNYGFAFYYPVWPLCRGYVCRQQ